MKKSFFLLVIRKIGFKNYSEITFFISWIGRKILNLTIPSLCIVGKNMQQQEPLSIVGKNVNWIYSKIVTLEDFLALSYKFEHTYTIQSNFISSRNCPRNPSSVCISENTCKRIHSNIV